jgi:hypothetical protein
MRGYFSLYDTQPRIESILDSASSSSPVRIEMGLPSSYLTGSDHFVSEYDAAWLLFGPPAHGVERFGALFCPNASAGGPPVVLAAHTWIRIPSLGSGLHDVYFVLRRIDEAIHLFSDDSWERPNVTPAYQLNLPYPWACDSYGLKMIPDVFFEITPPIPACVSGAGWQ